MANYTINKTDGSATITITNGQLNTQFSLPFIGQNYVGFGQIVAQNQLSMLENFRNITPPARALKGQLWYDSSESLLKVWTGKDPDGYVDGSDNSSHVANIGLWKVVGPAGIDGLDIGTLATPFDNLYVDNVFSTAGDFQILYVGITPNGCTLSNAGITPEPDSTADGIGLTLGNSSKKFKQSHVRNEYVYGTLNVGANTFASNKKVTLKADSSIDHTLIPDAAQLTHIGSSSATNKRFASVNASELNGTTLILGTGAAEGVSSSLIPVTDDAYDIGATLYAYNQGYINETISQTITPKTSTATIGAALNKFDVVYANTFDGIATQAEYADLAERYESDAPYECGTIVKIGGVKEITQTIGAADPNVFGVISTDPAFKMNCNAGADDTHPYVALVGRVPTKVVGKVIKGQRLVSSTIPGVAMAANGSEYFACIIGRALQTKNTEEVGLIEIVVGVK